MIVIFVVVVERESEESVRVLVYVHIKNVVLSIAMLFSDVVLVCEIARGVVKVELERDVASDGGVDDKLVVFLERWVLLQSLVCL